MNLLLPLQEAVHKIVPIVNKLIETNIIHDSFTISWGAHLTNLIIVCHRSWGCHFHSHLTLILNGKYGKYGNVKSKSRPSIWRYPQNIYWRKSIFESMPIASREIYQWCYKGVENTNRRSPVAKKWFNYNFITEQTTRHKKK